MAYLQTCRPARDPSVKDLKPGFQVFPIVGKSGRGAGLMAPKYVGNPEMEIPEGNSQVHFDNPKAFASAIGTIANLAKALQKPLTYF